MTLLNPCIKSIGPKDAKLAIIGEAPGEQEERTGIPFIGPSGQALDSMLAAAGLNRRDCFLTNLLFTRPPGNKLDEFLISKSRLPGGYTLPSVRQGKYLHPDLLPEIDRLGSEINALRPNLIITAGGPSTWAILGNSAITQLRGALHESSFGKVLPILHPATVLYDWSNRPIIISDLMKAKVECEFPEIRRPSRRLLIDPTLGEVLSLEPTILAAPYLAIDTETKRGHITDLGIAWSKNEALVIPFYDPRKPGNVYWTLDEELQIRKFCNRVLSSRSRKVFQNGLYDFQYLLKEGYCLNNCTDDTMILHHAMFPELPKSLGFMGSVYTNEASWKLMRHDESFKRDE